MATSNKNKLRRIWRISPKLAVAYLRRKVTRRAKQIQILLPKDDWNINWLGEEMRRIQVSNATKFCFFLPAEIGQKKEDNRATFGSQNLKKCHSYPRLKGIKSKR